MKVRSISLLWLGCDTTYDLKITLADTASVDLQTTSVLPVQVLEGQPLVLNKARAQGRRQQEWDPSLNDVGIKVLPDAGGELTSFYVDEPENRGEDATDFHLMQPSNVHPLNFCPGDTSKTIFFGGEVWRRPLPAAIPRVSRWTTPTCRDQRGQQFSLPSQILDVKDEVARASPSLTCSSSISVPIGQQ